MVSAPFLFFQYSFPCHAYVSFLSPKKISGQVFSSEKRNHASLSKYNSTGSTAIDGSSREQRRCHSIHLTVLGEEYIGSNRDSLKRVEIFKPKNTYWHSDTRRPVSRRRIEKQPWRGFKDACTLRILRSIGQGRRC